MSNTGPNRSTYPHSPQWREDRTCPFCWHRRWPVCSQAGVRDTQDDTTSL